jgi:circadian clock protein KaiC
VRDWLATSGLTGIVTARIEPEGGPLTGRYSFMQFMADCVVLLQRRLIDRVSLRELQVVKYRGSHFEQNAFPMSIGSQGIEVASFSSEDSEADVCAERVSSGVQRLDAMLGGGYYRGASVLITGAPGTAKSTLAALFTEAACRRGETTLYLSFDECGSVMVRDMCSVNVRLSPYIASGLLKMYSAYGMARSTGEHLIRLQALIREHQPRCMVIDPVSAMLKAGPPAGVAQELLHAAQRNGITIVFTSLTEAGDTDADKSAAPLLTLADTTIHLSYVAQAGERNRALTIVKSRGTRHSNQVRELILSDQGVALADVYTVGGEVLMGTLRKEKECVAQMEKEGRRAEVDRKRRELEATAADMQARMVALHRELETRQAEIAALLSAQQAQEELWDAEREDIGQMRGKDQQ